jgi:DnaJ-class molecular chaperone
MVFSRSCNACGGTGQQPPRPCPSCAGAGHEVRTERVTVRLPPGIADGERVRLRRQGRRRPAGGPAGDLYVDRARGARSAVPARGQRSARGAARGRARGGLGARIEVPVLDGTVKVRIPPGTQSGQRFRIASAAWRPRAAVPGATSSWRRG